MYGNRGVDALMSMRSLIRYEKPPEHTRVSAEPMMLKAQSFPNGLISRARVGSAQQGLAHFSRLPNSLGWDFYGFFVVLCSLNDIIATSSRCTIIKIPRSHTAHKPRLG
jgi:hypothetical protein